MIAETPLRVLLETLKLNTNINMADELRKIGVPTLIVYGDRDASAPPDLTGRKPAALIEGAALTVHQGAGHGLYASDHEALNADIVAFVMGRADPARRRCSPRNITKGSHSHHVRQFTGRGTAAGRRSCR